MRYFLFLLTLLFFHSISFAQWSEGGMPESFSQLSAAVTFTNLPPFDFTTMHAADSVNDQSKGAYRFGYNHMVDIDILKSSTPLTSNNGTRIWRTGITSSGASTINLTFDEYELPEGAKLFIYTPDKKFLLGAFTSKNNNASHQFATDLIPDDSIILEYDAPATTINEGHLHLYRVTHGYRGINDFVSTRSFGDAGSCQINVNCPLGDLWQHEKRGIICLVVGGNEFCSAVLVNDVPQDGTPYVLTANHCNDGDEASWVFRFNWETPACEEPATNPFSQSLSGGELKARSDTSDFCLVQITGGLSGGTIPASYAPFFNGWSNADVPADSIIAIHHPGGDVKKISGASNPVTSQYYNGVQCWKIGEWTEGCTEGGSSGSPIFDQHHHIVGQLYDGPSACNQPSNLMTDYYGKFSVSWLGNGTDETQLKRWLDPDNTGTTMIDGYDGALNSAVSSIHTLPGIIVFPNPNDGNFEVTTNSETAAIQLLDIQGRNIAGMSAGSFLQGKSAFQFRNVTDGMYIIRLVEKTSVVTQKVVVDTDLHIQ
ncbi:MAG: trypsin-like peptidase domain-containing protein [Chitinophagaceae bacterium]|nr:trypsin-like peptidase domain-containing protein [Chitinophagaceae bacterium]